MEEMIMKVGEFGALGLVCFYLLTKNTAAIKELSDSTKGLADSVKELAKSVAKQGDQIGSLDNRVTSFEYQLRGIESRLDKIENSLQRLNERNGGNVGEYKHQRNYFKIWLFVQTSQNRYDRYSSYWQYP